MANETFTVTQATVLNTGATHDGDAVIDPGEIVTTTVTITNNSTNTSATGVQFAETLSGMTLVPGTLKVTPIAFDDNGGLLAGNTPITFLESTFLANDVDPDGPEASLDIVSVGGATNGTVSINNTTGQITFTPTTGYEGPASFTYTVRDAQNLDSVSTGTVSLTVTDAVWYVNAASGSDTAGDGSYNNPFASLAPLSTGGSADSLDDAGDTIFVYDNSAGTLSYSGGIVLETNQKLIGDGVALSVNGLAIGNGPDDSGHNPFITSASGNTITLSSGNTLRGFDIGGSAAGTALAGTSFGTLSVDHVAINSSGQALALTTGNFGAGSTFTGVGSSAPRPAPASPPPAAAQSRFRAAATASPPVPARS